MGRVLLTGANGNIGFYLFNRLKQDYHIAPVTGSKSSNNEFIPLDLCNVESVVDFINDQPQFENLIFLVGLAHKKGKDIDEFRKINTQTLINLLSTLKEFGKLPTKIIFASTISVYGEKANQTTYPEDFNNNPFSSYAFTKLESEKYLQKHFPNQSWILRFAPVYSPNFLLNIERRTKSSGLFYKVGDGANRLSLCNLENICSTVKGILEDKVPAGVYNISDRIDYSYNDLLNWSNANWVVHIPSFFIKLMFLFGKVTNNIFLKENSIKLLTDNIYPSVKIRSFIDLPATLNEIKPVND